ncbi:MAG: ABC transporter ATP-binding protein [Armatimonadota bacterium]|nr:ABC transporter ATP-binding protein [Armatimonadota bacterium]
MPAFAWEWTVMQVRLEGVVKRFKTVEAMAGVSLTIREGEFFTLLGPSGCGKTTTLRVIAGFYDPDAGAVYFGETPMNGVPPADRGIGIVFQNYALWPHMTVRENVAYGLRIKRVPSSEIEPRVHAALRQVGLEGLEDRTPGQLSGGQQQRVAVARALVLNPRVLLLDEPLSNLDAKVRARLRSEIRRLQQDLRITTIYVTHDQEEALVLSDRIAVMDAGRVLQIGTPVDLYEHPATLFVADFIGTNNLVPGTVADVADGMAALRTPAGLWRGVVVGSLAPGAEAVAAIRPENLVLDEGAGPADVSFRARVVLTQYLGNLVRYELEAGPGVTLRVDVSDPKSHRYVPPGQDVAVGFRASSAQIFPADTASHLDPLEGARR